MSEWMHPDDAPLYANVLVFAPGGCLVTDGGALEPMPHNAFGFIVAFRRAGDNGGPSTWHLPNLLGVGKQVLGVEKWMQPPVSIMPTKTPKTAFMYRIEHETTTGYAQLWVDVYTVHPLPYGVDGKTSHTRMLHLVDALNHTPTTTVLFGEMTGYYSQHGDARDAGIETLRQRECKLFYDYTGWAFGIRPGGLMTVREKAVDYEKEEW